MHFVDKLIFTTTTDKNNYIDCSGNRILQKGVFTNEDSFIRPNEIKYDNEVFSIGYNSNDTKLIFIHKEILCSSSPWGKLNYFNSNILLVITLLPICN